MIPRLARPLIVAALTGALIAGGATLSAPASAATLATFVTEADDPTPLPTDPTADPTTPPAEPTAEPTTPTTTEPTADPTAEPTATATSEPTAEPTTEPTAQPTDSTPTSEPTPTDSPAPPADTTAPTGGFKLSNTAIWIGQRTSLTQVGIADDGVADPATVTRVVTWGDGGTSTLAPGSAATAKQYTKAGTFTITLTLTDAAGNKSASTAKVTVTVPGKYKLDKTSIYHGAVVKLKISSVPSSTTKIVVYWGDGYSSSLKGANQTVSHRYHWQAGTGLETKAGAKKLTTKFTNKLGTTSSIAAGTVTIKKDSWNPKVTITKPSKPTRASSWKTLKGTATDKGSGIYQVAVIVLKIKGSSVTCLNTKSKWIKATDANIGSCVRIVKVSKGKWSLKVPGLKKGYTLDAIAAAGDWSGRTSSVAERVQKLTS